MHLDTALRLYERRPLRALRRLAVARAQEWIVRRQEADGSWGGIQPPWVYSLMALHLGGYPLEHAVMRQGLEGLERFIVEDPGGDGFKARPPGVSDVSGSEPHPLDFERPEPRSPDANGSESRSPSSPDANGSESRPPGSPNANRSESRPPSRRLEACQSPVWDTALAMVALGEGGLTREHPALRRAGEWLLGEEVRVRGDWAVTRPDLEPGGWAFEFENDNYPDVDDTAEVVLALLGVTPLEPELVRRANRHRRRIGDLPARARRGCASARRTRSTARWRGWRGCRAPTAGGARSTWTTHTRWCGSSRSWTSAR